MTDHPAPNPNQPDALVEKAARAGWDFDEQLAAVLPEVERVRAAEEALRDVPCEHQRGGYLRMQAERDEARAKLDAVRALVTNPPVFGDLAPARWYGAADMQRDVLAILDGKPG